ncbi:MAG: trehalose-phosphatase [Acidobacteria bacterium]|nr:trehalose-phosphatase [Acidobacteriota bacterium]
MPRRLILASRHTAALAQFAASNVLVAFDYDGTLAPIAPTPPAARMRPSTRRLLAAVARLYPCVVLSGRALDDLTRRLRGVPVWHLVGDHGSEYPGALSDTAPHVREWVAHLNQQLPPVPGLMIEQKRHSVTIHYRRVRDKERVLAALADAVRNLHDARVIGGAQAVNLIHFSGPNKGIALQRARRVFACDTAIYAGDDETDEDAFQSGGPEELLSIKVGTQGTSAARYRLRSQAEIDALLRMLVDLRRVSGRAAIR